MTAGLTPNPTSICYNQKTMSTTLSPQTLAKLQELRTQQAAYEQRPEDKRKLANRTVLAFVGAACEGKNTLMDATVAADRRFHVIGTVTSRAPRESDNGLPYTYYEHTDAGLETLFADISDHKLVQYFVAKQAPFHVYGSDTEDYPGEYNVGDYFAHSIADMRTRGFKKVIALTVITPPEVWLRRFEERFPQGHELRIYRRDEAIESFEWSLAQPTDGTHFWVENTGDPEAAAQTIVNIALGKSKGSPKAAELCRDSLDVAKRMAA